MRPKEKRLIASFYTTHDAMAFEEYCLGKRAAGRLIPLPREISAGCGLAWSAPPDDEDGLRELFSASGVTPQEIRLLYV